MASSDNSAPKAVGKVEDSKNGVVCDKCKGKMQPGKDHIDDLVDQVASSTKTEPLVLLNYHWPQFVANNHLMQVYCSICKLHFRGLRHLVTHLYNARTEDGRHLVANWTPELGAKHAQLYIKLKELIKEIDSKGPHASTIPKIDAFVCPNSIRHFETAFRTNKFAPKNDANCEYDARNNETQIMEYNYRMSLNVKATGFEVDIDKSKFVPTNPLDPRLIQSRLIDVASCLRDNLNEDIIPDREPVKSGPSRMLFECLCCNQKASSVRQHVNDTFWIVKQAYSGSLDHRGMNQEYASSPMMKHLSFLMAKDTEMLLNDAAVPSCVYCPFCHFHLRMRRGFATLFGHLRYHGCPGNYKPNAFSDGHLELMNFITELFCQRYMGEVSVSYVMEALRNKFVCTEGGVYLGPGDETSKKPFVQALNKKRGIQASITNGSQTNKRQKDSTIKGLMSVGKPNFNVPQPILNSVFCDLCQQQCVNVDALRDHIRQALFTSGPAMAKNHVKCFPAPLIYQLPCRCPACGVNTPTFADCLGHLCMCATQAPMDKHMMAANFLIDKYIMCMNGSLSVADVAQFIKNTYCISW